MAFLGGQSAEFSQESYRIFGPRSLGATTMLRSGSMKASGIMGRWVTAMLPTLTEHCRWRATRAGDVLDQWMRAETKMQGKKLDVLQFVSPFTACIRQPWSQCFLIAASVYLLYDACVVFSGVQHYGSAKFETFRLDAIDPGAVRNITGHLGINLLMDGCVAVSRNVSFMGASSSNGVPLISLSSPLGINGFSLAMDSEWNSSRTIEFVLQGSNDGGSTWNVAGSSHSRFVPRGIRFLKGVSDSLKETTFDFRPPWPLFQESAIDSVILALGCICVAICGAMNRHDIGKTIFMWFSCVLALNEFVAGCGFLCLGMTKYSFNPFIESMVYFLFYCTLTMAEKFCFDSLRVLSVVGLACRFISDCDMFHDCDYLSRDPPIKPIFFGIVGFGFIFVRDRFLFKALGDVSRDRARYDAEWQKLARDPDQRVSLQQLNLLAKLVKEEAASHQARQLNRMRAESKEERAARRVSVSASVSRMCRCWRKKRATAARHEDYGCPKTVPGKVDTAAPVTSLDQLYCQAMGVVARMQAKCVEWAAASRGAVDNAEGQEDSSKDTMSLPGPMEKWMRLRFLKKPSRAIEKAMVCYLGDVSLLLDICRGRIVFDEVSDLCACLDIIRSEAASLRIVRIRNCLDDEYDSWLTAGFRGVILNVCFDTEETRFFGVENHICEIQLLVRRLVNNKTLAEQKEQHARFLNFRAVRMFAKNFRKHRRAAPKAGGVWPEVDSSLMRTSSAATDIESGDLSCIQEDQVYPFTLGAKDEGEPTGDGMACQPINETSNLCSEGDRVRLMYMIFVRSALTAGGILDRQASQVEKAFEQSSAGSVWFTSKPLAAAATKKVFQLFQMMLAGFYLYRGIISSTTVVQAGQFRANMLRFEVLELRNPSLPLSAMNFSNLGLLKDGCNFAVDSTLNRSNHGFVLSLAKEVTANGYSFVTSDGLQDTDPVRWLVEASRDNGTSWEAIGASGWRINWNGKVDFCPQLSYPTPLARNHEVFLDRRESWPMIVRSCMNGFEWAVGMSLGVLAGMSGQEDFVKTIFAIVLTSGILFLSVSGIGFHLSGNLRDAGSVWLEFAPQCVFAFGIIFFEARIVSVFFLYSVTFIVALFINDLGLYRDELAATLAEVLPSPPTGTFFFACAVVYFRSRVLADARRLVLEDKACYDEIWDAVRRTAGAQGSLLELQAEVKLQTQGKFVGMPRQYNRLQDDGAGGAGGENLGVPGTLDLSHPVCSLDQLFVQATCLHPILLAKVKTWAGASFGCFAMAGSGSFVLYDDASKRGAQQMKFAKVKSVSRAIEKVYRSFGQDVSMLADLCRQSIVFDEVSHIVMCLKTVAADVDVQIVRIKNRLDPGYDAAASAGYRDVALNLRIVSDETKALGIETHVCELQLLLRPIAELKSDAGHKRYVTFRNLRGE